MNKYLSHIAILVLFINGMAAYAREDQRQYSEVAERIVKAINAKDYKSVTREFDAKMLETLSPEKSQAYFVELSKKNGYINKLTGPALVTADQATFTLHFDKSILDMKIALDEKDKIAGLWFYPHTPPPPTPQKHKTSLRLPFEGTWYVLWGGNTKELNKHRGNRAQNYAMDFVIKNNGEKSYKNDGKVNEDYYAFGRDVLAPGDGVVTDVIEGVRDNRPGSTNATCALGNAVFIEHCEQEVSVIAHFKQGSICVKVGDIVKQGQVLGLCGNSGYSTEPHVHYHMQNTSIIQDASGIKCVFDKIELLRDGDNEIKKKYSPIKGAVICNYHSDRPQIDAKPNYCDNPSLK